MKPPTLIPFKKYSVQELNKRQLFKDASVLDKRRNVRIAVIDDEEFSPQKSLQAEGFQVVHLGECTDMRIIRKHHIIICDVNKVGQDKNKEEHGAATIAEIKRIFPEKPVIVHSGLFGNVKKLRLAKERSDEFISKSAELSVWNQILDKMIERSLDPVWVWKGTLERLKEENIPLKDIVSLEDKFVRSVIKSDPKTLKSFQEKQSSEFISDVLSSLIASAIWATLA